MTVAQRDQLIATCVRALPDEGCGVLLGEGDRVVEVVPGENVAHSARVYEIDPKALLRAFRRADELGVEVLGVFHSHTHSDAYPSPTDVQQAPDPSWHYVIASLRSVPTVVRSFRVSQGAVTEEPLHLNESGGDQGP